MNEEEETLKGQTISEKPSITKPMIWALVWFLGTLIARVLASPLANFVPDSERYLVLWPVSFGSMVVMLAAAVYGFIRFIFPNTLFKDSGTRFNKAYAEIKDPFQLMLINSLIMGSIIIALALLAANAA